MKLREWFSGFLEEDAYNKKAGRAYTVLHIYYDTEHSDFVRYSLSKSAYKEKLRLRSYGTPDADSRLYIEIKKKVWRIVNKRRSSIGLAEAYSFLESGKLPIPAPYMNYQVLKETSYLLEKNRLLVLLVS